jgi:hypothetical protein
MTINTTLKLAFFRRKQALAPNEIRKISSRTTHFFKSNSFIIIECPMFKITQTTGAGYSTNHITTPFCSQFEIDAFSRF